MPTNKASFVETNCIIEHEGKTFESGGAIISDQFIVAYPGESDGCGHGYNWCPATHRHDLLDWHGNKIGTYRIMSTWRTPRSYVCSTMSSIECFVNGIRYVGRGPGEGMALRAKKSSNQRITK